MISVVIATYNGEKFIYKQLESIRNQTISPDEVIIHDDRSTDRTVEIVQSFIDEYSLHHWKLTVNEENKGFVKNYWNALLESKGDLVFLCDQDDIWLSNKIEAMSQIQNETQCSMLHSEVNIIDNNDKIIGYAHEKLRKGTRSIKLKQYLHRLHYCGMSSVLTSDVRDLARRIDPEGLNTHDWFWGILSIECNGFYTTDGVYTLRRFHGDNVALNISEKIDRKGIKQRTDRAHSYVFFYGSTISLLEYIKGNVENINLAKKYYNIANKREQVLASKNIKEWVGMSKNLSYFPSFKAYICDGLYIAGIF